MRLERPCDAIVGERTTLGLGQVLGVGVRGKLVELLAYVEERGRVFVKTEGQHRLKDGRKMWLFTVKGEPGKRRRYALGGTNHAFDPRLQPLVRALADLIVADLTRR